MNALNRIRTAQTGGSVNKRILVLLAMLVFGICMGTCSKYLDYRQAHLPSLLQTIDQALDLHNFLGGFAPWIVIAVFISVCSPSPLWAGGNVFAFFVGMVTSYYCYSYFVAGFFPKSYAQIWMAFTLVSPFLACLCWYAKGKGMVAFFLSSCMLSVLINTAFAYGMFYLDIRSWPQLAMFLLAVFVLHKSPKETAAMTGVAGILAVISKSVIPFQIW